MALFKRIEDGHPWTTTNQLRLIKFLAAAALQNRYLPPTPLRLVHVGVDMTTTFLNRVIFHSDVLPYYLSCGRCSAVLNPTAEICS